jgi:hypothetical protein
MGVGLLTPPGRHKHFVMAGLVPAIHVFLSYCKDVDARVKHAHDGVPQS